MRRLIGILSVTLLTSLYLSAQGIEFEKGSWNDALAKAKEENKLIFVDAYAQWCGPCKRMAATVFPTKEAGAFFNTNFINYKMDMERGEGPAFGKKYPVRAYPTLMFIDGDGELVHKKIGAQSTQSLIALGKKALTMVDKSPKYAEKYAKGDRSPELVYNYIKALNEAGKASNKVANEYFKGKKGQLPEADLNILFEALTRVDSRVYTLFNNNKKGIQKLYNQEQIDQKVLAAARRTLSTALEYQSLDLVTQTKDKVAENCSSSVSKDFANKADLDFSFLMKDWKTYTKALRAFTKDFSSNRNLLEAEDILKKGISVMQTDKKIASGLEDLAEATTKAPDAQYTHFVNYAKILHFNGNKKAAVAALDQAEEMCESQENIQKRIQRLRKEMLE